MRWIVRIVLSLVLLVILLVAAVFLLPAEKIGALASSQLRQATGRELTLSGRLRPALWPQIGVTTGPVTLSNADWSDEGPMLRAESLSIGLDLSALMGGEIKLRKIEVTAPQILLERSADGRANWEFAGAAEASAQSGEKTARSAPTAFTLDKAVISTGTVRYLDHAAGTSQQVQGLDATLSLPAFDGPAKITLAAKMNGQPVSLDGELGAFGPFLAGKVTPVTADLSAGKAHVAFDGRAGIDPLAADGTMDTDASDLASLFRALGSAPPVLPKGAGRKIALKGRVTYTPEGSLHLRDGTITLDDNRLSGAADLFLDRPRPKLTGQFTAGALDLSAFTASDGAGGGGGGGKDAGWSTAPIDAGPLGALDAEVAVTADSVNLGDTQLGRTRILATLSDRRLVIDLREVRAYDGVVTGNVVLNGRGGLSVGGDLTVAGMALQKALGDLAGYERLIGSADMHVKFLGSGNSVDAIMNSLSGSGAVALGKGELQGLDLVGMLRTLDTTYVGKGAKTIFDSIAGQFTIKDGVLSNDDLAFVAPLLTAGGKGRVLLGKQKLDYRILPVAFQGAEGKGGFKVPLKITGTWADPHFSLDMEAVAKDQFKLDEKKKALEEKAKAQVQGKIADQLGVTPEADESLEDAAKRKLKDEAAKGLLNLLGK